VIIRLHGSEKVHGWVQLQDSAPGNQRWATVRWQ
jgi:hypothetical protein